jgi:hypothetical protein
MLRTSTSTPGTTAPLLSTTVPSMTAVVICDCAAAGTDAANQMIDTVSSYRDRIL